MKWLLCTWNDKKKSFLEIFKYEEGAGPVYIFNGKLNKVLDFIISTGTCIYDTLEGFQRRGTQKNTTI
jgi:hypothetical protein